MKHVEDISKADKFETSKSEAPKTEKRKLLFMIQYRDNTAGQAEYQTLPDKFASAEEATARIEQLRQSQPQCEYKIVPPVDGA